MWLLKVNIPRSVLSSWFLVLGSRFLVLSSWFSVPGSWFLVLGSWFLVLGSRLLSSAIEIASGRLFAGRPPAWTLPRRPPGRSPGAKRPLRRGFNRMPEQLRKHNKFGAVRTAPAYQYTTGAGELLRATGITRVSPNWKYARSSPRLPDCQREIHAHRERRTHDLLL